ncbi:hypothetical protein [Desulfurococcus amylolyticus]|uniref:Uncharacterized protein n=1 Tax=Desulfurococcus amylolyticus (strain DSM 18924 / JCM 16383 / VKM B-2413 / 1221n) TaxID=490899 RepID=B8D671_DESA1|nr:hypothetical protein [Desulfurococcus amylolyticus]ACL11602.1 hypothetical protein DKAM_1276 [Desulfurococcus amylolyticus 1221n]
MSREIRRRFVPISDEIIQEALDVAERYGMPYSVIIEKSLEGLLKIMKYKSSILESIVLVDAVDDLRRLGLVFLPMSIARKILDDLDEALFNQLLEELSRSSRWFGELSRVKRGSSPREFQTSLSLWMPMTTIDVVKESEEVYRFVISIADASPRLMRVLEKILSSMAAGYDLKILDLTVNINTVVVKVTGFLEKE